MAVEKRNVRNLAVGFLFLLSFLFFINPLTRTALGIFILFLAITIAIYSIKEYYNDLVGISGNRFFANLIIAGIIAGLFFLVAKLFPAFSILYPSLPASISDNLKLLVIVFVAPIAEELFFRGSLLGFLNHVTSRKKIWIALIVSSLFFSVFHIIAYAGEIYTFQNFSQVLLSFTSNFSAFLSAFIAGMMFGLLAIKYKNLTVPILAHMFINLLIYATLSVVIA